MNNESPLVPQGSFLEQKNQGRNRVKIAVFVVLAIHGAGLMALLMQGCQKAPDTTGPAVEAVDTNAPVAPSFAENPTYGTPAPAPDTNVPIVTDTTSAPSFAAQTSAPPTVPEPLPLDTTPQTTPMSTTPATASISQHKIAPGDTLGKLAKTYKVSVKAIEAANPGIEPTRLQVNQVIQIPAPAPTPTLAVATGAPEAGANGGETYKVKSGDNLIRIAAQHGVSVKALRAANGLRTDQIRVNQVLKIPARTAPSGGSAAVMGATSAPPTGFSNP